MGRPERGAGLGRLVRGPLGVQRGGQERGPRRRPCPARESRPERGRGGPEAGRRAGLRPRGGRQLQTDQGPCMQTSRRPPTTGVKARQAQGEGRTPRWAGAAGPGQGLRAPGARPLPRARLLGGPEPHAGPRGRPPFPGLGEATSFEKKGCRVVAGASRGQACRGGQATMPPGQPRGRQTHSQAAATCCRGRFAAWPRSLQLSARPDPRPDPRALPGTPKPIPVRHEHPAGPGPAPGHPPHPRTLAALAPGADRRR